jgi:hypothetical protein
VESKIAGEFNGWEGKTIVKLINGQIWQLTEYHYEYRYAYMPEVIIYPTAGGPKMKVYLGGSRHAEAQMAMFRFLIYMVALACSAAAAFAQGTADILVQQVRIDWKENPTDPFQFVVKQLNTPEGQAIASAAGAYFGIPPKAIGAAIALAKPGLFAGGEWADGMFDLRFVRAEPQIWNRYSQRCSQQTF